MILVVFQRFDRGTTSNKTSNRKILTFEYLIHTFYAMLLILLKTSCSSWIVTILLEDAQILFLGVYQLIYMRHFGYKCRNRRFQTVFLRESTRALLLSPFDQ